MFYSDTCNKQFRSQKVNQYVGRFYYELPSNMNYFYHPCFFPTMPFNTCRYAHVLSLYIRNYPLTLPVCSRRLSEKGISRLPYYSVINYHR